MSIQSAQNKVNQVRKQVSDLLKKENAEKKKQLDIKVKINDLAKRSFNTKSVSTLQSNQRQINTKEKELLRFEKNIADLASKLATKKAELAKAETQLSKEIDKDVKKKNDLEKKRFDNERKIMQQRESANRQEIQHLQSVSNQLRIQKNLFTENIPNFQSELKFDDNEFGLEELIELNKRIDKVLIKLNNLGLGQEILFNEIASLKEKGRKISKKDLKVMLVGQIASFGAKTIDTETAQEIFQTITGIDMSNLLK